MDTLTHGLAGAMLARAAAKEKVRAAVAIATVAAMFPDCDAFFLEGSPAFPASTLSYLDYHRGVTHSFLMAPAFALLMALLAKVFSARSATARLWRFALLGIVSHILSDWITSYGTMFFSPLSWTRYSLDWVFILDPTFSGILLVSLLASAVARRRSRAWAAAGSLSLLAYIAFCAATHARALSAARRLESDVAPERVAALPQPFSPFHWELLADRGTATDMAGLGLSPWSPLRVDETRALGFRDFLRRLDGYYPRPSAALLHRFPSWARDAAVERTRGFPDVRRWLRFARFPVARSEPAGGGNRRVTWIDLRFRGPWGRTAFEYEAIVSPDGRELTSGFVRIFVTGEGRRR